MATKIIGSGGDYSSLNSWWSTYVPTTLTENETAQITGTLTTANTLMSGKTYGSYRVTIEGKPGECWTDHTDKNTNAIRYDASTGAAIDVSGGGSGSRGINISGGSGGSPGRVTIRNLQIKCVPSGHYSGFGVHAEHIFDSVLKGIIVENATNGAYSYDIYCSDPGNNTTDVLFESCYSINKSSNTGGFYYRRSGEPARGLMYNCGAVNISGSTGSGTGFLIFNFYTDWIVANCFAHGFNADYSLPSGSTNKLDTNCASDKTSGTTGLLAKTNAVFSLSSGAFTSLTSGSENLRLAVGSALINAASNTYAPALDALGNARSGTADIGPIEYGGVAPGGGGSAPVIVDFGGTSRGIMRGIARGV